MLCVSAFFFFKKTIILNVPFVDPERLVLLMAYEGFASPWLKELFDGLKRRSAKRCGSIFGDNSGIFPKFSLPVPFVQSVNHSLFFLNCMVASAWVFYACSRLGVPGWRSLGGLPCAPRCWTGRATVSASPPACRSATATCSTRWCAATCPASRTPSQPPPPMLEAAGTCQAFQHNNGRWVWGRIPTTEPEDGAKKAVGVPAAACQPLKVKHLPL